MPSMANSKPMAELPRFLLPRLTWTTAFLVETAPQSIPIRSSIKRTPKAPTFKSVSKPRSIHTSAVKGLTPAHSPRRSRTFVHQLAPDSVPIRHNGVYVAAFKPARKAFSTTAVQRKDHHFDTLKFVQRLKDEGFKE